MRRFGQYLLFSLFTSILTIILFTSSSSEGVWAEELIDNPLRRAKLSEMNIVPPKPILNVDIYNGIEDYEVGQLPQERIRRKLIHHTFFPDAHIGFTSIGNCISIGIVPALSFNITDTFTIEAGAGAGYKDLSTEMWVPEGEKDNDGNVMEYGDYLKRDKYAIWYTKFLLGFTLRRPIPNFEFAFQFIGVFHGVDHVRLSSEKDDNGKYKNPPLPLFDGAFRASFWYGITHSTNLLRWGWSTSLVLSYYIQNYYTIAANVFYGFKPLVIVKSNAGKHLFGLVYNANVSFDHYGSFQTWSDGKDGNINNYFRSGYKFSVISGQTIDKPFSIYWNHNIRMSGPVLWEFRPYGRVFFQIGGTWGPHYYDRSNNSFEWEMSTGIELAIGIHDYVGGAIRFSVPVNLIGSLNSSLRWKVEVNFTGYLEQV